MKLQAPVYSMSGKKVGALSLEPKVFGVTVAPSLLTRAVTAERSKARQVLAHTKTRAERRGGGRKPWKQKGTGRARHGSIRSPIWRKGGVTFGPRSNRNFELKINRKERRQAVRGALSLVAGHSGVLVLEDLKLDKIKTKPLAELLTKLGLKRKTLLVIGEPDPKIIRSARNLAQVKMRLATNLNIGDLMAHTNLVATKTALERITKIYLD